MKRIILIYDDQLENDVKENVIPLFGSHLKSDLAYKNFKSFIFGEEDFLVCFLSDDQLKEFLPFVTESHYKIGFLPHPKMKHARQGFGISSRFEEAVDNILKTEEVLEVDVLYANGIPIFNTLVIGNSLSLMYGSVTENTAKRLFEKIGNFFKMFKRVSLHRYFLDWANEKGEMRDKPLETAALGIVTVQHGKSTLLSRRILKDSFVNDGLMHNLILSPRSVGEMIQFSIIGLFQISKSERMPPFASLIKTDRMLISSSEPINFSLDDNLMSAKEIELMVIPKVLSIVPGVHLKTDETVNSSKVFKTKSLPQGELREGLLGRYLPLTNHATTEEFKWLFSILRENSKTTSSFLVLMALSTLIATFGLFGNSSPVIIGAMILAPLMSPIVSLSMGVLRQDEQLIRDSLKAIGFGMLIGYVFAVLITWLTPLNSMNSEIVARIRPNLLDLGVAAGSGIAGAYAHAKKEIAKTLAGVAIAVALVPPLAVSGIGLGWGDWQVFWGALLLLGTNLAGMVLAGAVTFLFLGFSPFRLARKGLFISLMFVVMISAPLAFGFSKMVKENRIIQNLSGKELAQGVLRDIRIIQLNPLRLSLTLVSEKPLDQDELQKIKKKINDLVGEEVGLEVSVGLKL
jgi:uncharacterized hydrophobic protein (TIGR00271 family)